MRLQIDCERRRKSRYFCQFSVTACSPAMAFLQKIASIDAQMRLLVPKRVSDDDKLIEYDALLLDRFLDIVEDLHGKELKETVHQFP